MYRSAPSILILAFLLGGSSSVLAQKPLLQETWETGYQGADIKGTHVLGYWKFDGEKPLSDASEKGRELTLHGAKLAASGKFGSGLESFPGFPSQDKRHAAVTTQVSGLSPKGAFTLEMWVKPKAEFQPEWRCYLLDKKYAAHTDYQWQLSEAGKAGERRMSVTLGFGGNSETLHSEAFSFETDVWQHVAFTYDGLGEGRFYHNGQSVGGMKLTGYASITPGSAPLSIGDRLGSHYGGFPGFIDEVRICEGVRNFEQVRLEIRSERQVWRRMEKAKPILIACTNLRREPLKGASLKVILDGKEETFSVPDLASGQTHLAPFTLNTALKPQPYRIRVKLELSQPKPYSTETAADYEIVPRIPKRMPVVMWGSSAREASALREFGFTHCLGLDAEYNLIWNAKAVIPPSRPEGLMMNRKLLDEALTQQVDVIATLSPVRTLLGKPEYMRLDRSGKPMPREDICASMPEFAPFFENVGRSVSKAYGDHPAFAGALINTEVRDGSTPSFNPVDIENYRKFASSEIPLEVTNRWGVDWTKIKDFPSNRVIPDEHPILKYYRWFWTVGDGWNALHSALNKGVKTGSQRDFWTFFDPAVRQPSISGAGGNVDYLAHWTYTYPDPQRIGLATDQLAVMSAASGRNQGLMKMTQIIWYRSQTAPIKAGQPGNPVAWEDYDPDAAYITIAPMHLKEAFWTKIARPIKGIMYHGWQSLVDLPGNTSTYRFTNADAAPVLKELIHQVIEPLGPSLMEIPDERSEVAFLESFTSQMFARRGGYGNNLDWAADVWMALQHAHVQTDILFEETLLKGGLNGRKVLVMPFCDVLTETVVARIQEFQKRGGKVIADQYLCPAIKADVLLDPFKREKKAKEDKDKVLAVAKVLREQSLPQKVLCDHPEVIVRSRRFGDALYVFVVNDQREFGSYVGQHGLVMENGLPSRATLGLTQDQANVYDLTQSALVVPKRKESQGIEWPVELGPCDGGIYMVTTKPLLGLHLELPETAQVGNAVKAQARVTTTDDAALKAVIPVRVDIRDASGKLTEGSGHYAAKNGTLDLELQLAPNDSPGMWEVRIRELASGMETVKWLRVQP